VVAEVVHHGGELGGGQVRDAALVRLLELAGEVQRLGQGPLDRRILG